MCFITVSYLFERFIVGWVAKEHNRKLKLERDDEKSEAEKKLAELSQ